MTRQALWTVLLDLSVEIDALVAAEAADLPGRRPLTTAPPRVATPLRETAWRDVRAGTGAIEVPAPMRTDGLDERDHERLGGLREAVRRRLETLWAAFAGEPGFERIRRALLVHFDERIMRLLPDYLRLSWPLMQTEVTRTTTGGSEFFTAIDDALHDPRTPALVLEVYYYCLSHGFVGMFATDSGQIHFYKQRLAERIPHPSAVSEPLDPEPGELPQPWPTWRYYALGLLVVVASAWLLTALSNHPVGGML